MNSVARAKLSKVPEVTLAFWIIKIAATTLGETGGDAVSMSLQLGYAVSTAIFVGILVVAVGAQIAAKSFHPFLYWAVIIATTTAGTTMADFADRSLGIGYAGGSSILFVLLTASFAVWYWSAGSVSVSTVTSPRIEAFYWATILFSQTLGTALGDWMADTTGLGYEGGALVFAAALALVAAGYFYTKVSRTLLFWSALSSPGRLAPRWATCSTNRWPMAGSPSAVSMPRRSSQRSSPPASCCCRSGPDSIRTQALPPIRLK